MPTSGSGRDEYNDERHKREQASLREKRKAAKMSKSDSKLEKDRKIKEHAQRVLKEQKQKREAEQHQSSSSSSQHHHHQQQKKKHHSKEDADGGSSAFQALFSKRAEGFIIDLNFRNAPPRPPVGPVFVGLGLDGELTDKWTKYKPFNAVEVYHTWKLHTEPDLGVPLAPSAMDLEGCYSDPTKVGGGSASTSSAKKRSRQAQPPSLHPDDAALIDWKGSMGDTAAEERQKRRDRARAMARMQEMNGGKRMPPSTTRLLSSPSSNNAASSSLGLAKKNKGDFKSRVLNERMQSWMKKTTYLANDQTKAVHRFKSLAQEKRQKAEEVEKKLIESTKHIADRHTIEAGFELAARQSASLDSGGSKDPKVPRLRHPTKRDVRPVASLPLLPDVSTWGYTYTHVVIDNPPRPSKSRPRPPSAKQLDRAFIADVERRKSRNARTMICNFLVPTTVKDDDDDDAEEDNNDSPLLYDVVQQYDLDVIPLRDEDSPHVNFLLMIDEINNVATYHPVSSRVQLSTGRPAGRAAAGAMVSKREPHDDEKREIEMTIAEVDADLARKHDLDVDGADAGAASAAGGGASGSKRKFSGSDDDDDDDESD